MEMKNEEEMYPPINNKKHPRRIQIMVIVSVICLVAAIAVPGIVRAAIATINTDDGSWDGNWGTPMRVDGNSGPVGFDIDTFWVNTDASSPSVYYFGLTTVGTLDPNAIVYFFIDCNDNGSYADSADRILEYDPLNDWVTEYTGDEVTIEFSPGTNGEVIGGNSVEAQTDNIGGVSWAGCQTANHNIKAEIWNDIITNVPDTSPSQSGTIPRTYDLPSTVSLVGFNGGLGNKWIGLVAFIIIGLAGGLIWTAKVLFARKKRA